MSRQVSLRRRTCLMLGQSTRPSKETRRRYRSASPSCRRQRPLRASRSSTTSTVPTGSEYVHLKLDARLLAKLLTESYTSNATVQVEDKALRNPKTRQAQPDRSRRRSGVPRAESWYACVANYYRARLRPDGNLERLRHDDCTHVLHQRGPGGSRLAERQAGSMGHGGQPGLQGHQVAGEHDAAARYV